MTMQTAQSHQLEDWLLPRQDEINDIIPDTDNFELTESHDLDDENMIEALLLS